ncbi:MULTISPECIES: tautomerase family protein [Kordiimonas]|uniref:tautomerase family protein n=1 Tax=Kordiimonas TaxID=288021 RepID=UPI001FF18457|nr:MULTISPECIES: 4-oxalocrotonate tautomerase family protein [Kordiimonas]MCK0069428.1 4-oxalocrotonate tautomerase family protein [Kordiimonas laminariae]UTW58774.1 4-oxalocrotonate tautomerase family protein [Kordiimonas sp. SCSIO 12603]
MPLITVKVFKDELSQSQSKELIEKVTDSVLEVTSEKLRDATWVVIEEVKDGQWGVGGNALGLDDVKAMIAD